MRQCWSHQSLPNLISTVHVVSEFVSTNHRQCPWFKYRCIQKQNYWTTIRNGDKKPCFYKHNHYWISRDHIWQLLRPSHFSLNSVLSVQKNVGWLRIYSLIFEATNCILYSLISKYDDPIFIKVFLNLYIYSIIKHNMKLYFILLKSGKLMPSKYHSITVDCSTHTKLDKCKINFRET